MPTQTDELTTGTDSNAAENEEKNESTTPKKKVTPLVVHNQESAMNALPLSDTPEPPETGELVDGTVIHIGKSAIYLDIKPFGTGIIYGREYMVARDLIKKINIGDVVNAKIVDVEGEDGYIELSLKEARQAVLWGEAESYVEQKTPLQLMVKDANKGGLLIDWQGLIGFLPASQLKPDHYPRVEDGSKEKILEELKKLVGTRLPVVMISAIPAEEKLIFSEKDYVPQAEKEEKMKQYDEGEIVDGAVTGVVDFGVFVKIDGNTEGLVHISEIDWGLVDDPRNMFTVGDPIKAKVIESTKEKISLSIKALKENPWTSAAKKYQKDDEVTAVVIKFNKHGMLASIEEGVAGLVHVSEFGSMEKLREQFELGGAYPFKITLFNSKEQKMTLSPVSKEEG